MDVLVFMQEPVITGCYLRAKAIGLMPIDQGEKDDKIIDVCADDPEYKHYTEIKQLSPNRLTEIKRFFEDHKKNENKEVAVNDLLPPETAYEPSSTPWIFTGSTSWNHFGDELMLSATRDAGRLKPLRVFPVVP